MDEIKDAKLYRVPEICEMLNVSRPTLYKWMDEGKIKAIPHINQKYRRVFGKYLKEFLNGGTK